ncbi:hypothetical protein KC218_24960, partial [Mycobacterium tuberculosis]|nr:hypothetical protein [Mycobacterium tuberculosis]
MTAAVTLPTSIRHDRGAGTRANVIAARRRTHPQSAGDAALDEIAALRADDLLVDRLLQAFDMALR